MEKYSNDSLRKFQEEIIVCLSEKYNYVQAVFQREMSSLDLGKDIRRWVNQDTIDEAKRKRFKYCEDLSNNDELVFRKID